MDSLPKTLYKYFGPDRVDVISGGLLRYTQLGAFNDPFEGQPELTTLDESDNILKALHDDIPKQAEISYNNLPTEIRAKLTLNKFIEELRKKAKEQENELIKAIHEYTPEAHKTITNKFNEYFGALCLSEVRDSLLMWSHYALGHTGFVLCFDTSHSHFQKAKSFEDELRHLRRVVYRDSRPRGTLSEMEMIDYFLVKSVHWSYEREWRIIHPLSDSSTIIPDEPFDIHLFTFPPDALQAIIVGARATDKTKNEILNAIASNNAMSHVKIKYAKPDQSHFLLNISDY